MDCVPTMDDHTRPERLDREAANEIIRRAAELDARPLTDDTGVDRRALEAAAEEVGISPAAVRHAIAEHEAGALVRPADRSILGPAHALVVRTVRLPVPEARSRVDRWLRGQLLEVQQRRGDEDVWCRRKDLAAKLRRKVDPTKKVRLGGVDAVCASVADVGDGRSIVRLEADLEFTRRGLLTGVAAIPTAAGPVLGGAAALVLAEPLFFLGGFPVGAALGGVGLYAGRRTLASEREEARRVLELFLDELDRGR